MISPQEKGATHPEQATITLLGSEVGAVLAWLSLFPTTGPCVAGVTGCSGTTNNIDEGGMICPDCADLQATSNAIRNVIGEIKRQWAVAK